MVEDEIIELLISVIKCGMEVLGIKLRLKTKQRLQYAFDFIRAG
jgi:hypothetical protein